MGEEPKPGLKALLASAPLEGIEVASGCEDDRAILEQPKALG